MARSSAMSNLIKLHQIFNGSMFAACKVDVVIIAINSCRSSFGRIDEGQ